MVDEASDHVGKIYIRNKKRKEKIARI